MCQSTSAYYSFDQSRKVWHCIASQVGCIGVMTTLPRVQLFVKYYPFKRAEHNELMLDRVISKRPPSLAKRMKRDELPSSQQWREAGRSLALNSQRSKFIWWAIKQKQKRAKFTTRLQDWFFAATLEHLPIHLRSGFLVSMRKVAKGK